MIVVNVVTWASADARRQGAIAAVAIAVKTAAAASQ